MVEPPGSRRKAIISAVFPLSPGALVYRIGFDVPAPIVNQAYQSSVNNPAH